MTLSDYVLIDARVAYAVLPDIELLGRIENAANTHYQDVLVIAFQAAPCSAAFAFGSGSNGLSDPNDRLVKGHQRQRYELTAAAHA